MKTTTQNNIEIAQFVGMHYAETSKCLRDKRQKPYRVHRETELQYHTSWDWLMPAIKKAQGIAYEKMTFAEYDDYRNQWKMIENPSKYPIENVSQQLAEFIQWYNQNQTGQCRAS